MMTGLHAVKGYFLVKRYSQVNWFHMYQQDLTDGKRCLDWRRIRHMVIIPNYTESIDKLRLCLDGLAKSEVASQIVAVLAMEAREGEEGQRKAEILQREYTGKVGEIFATFHPAGLVGEVAGKSSNENWAAQVAKKLIVDQEGHPIEYVTITSCDVDTVFHPKYFSGVSYHFATDPDRYRRFWQAPILYYNNIWEVPAPLRLPHALAGLNHLGKLSRSRFRMVFPQSSYTLSLKMAHRVGYWDTDIVPEDWHMFLKCFYAQEGEVDVTTIYHPMYMDGIRSKTYLGTFVNYYQQARRHAWGCSDIPYVVQQVIDHPEIPLMRRLRRAWGLIESHLLWSTQWYIVTVARTVPLMTIPLIKLQLAEPFGGIPDWYGVASKWLLTPCAGTLIILIFLDTIMRPSRPKHFRWWLFPFQFVQWALMAVITFFTSALPALDAQVRLALGKRMEYKVTEKA